MSLEFSPSPVNNDLDTALLMHSLLMKHATHYICCAPQYLAVTSESAAPAMRLQLTRDADGDY